MADEYDLITVIVERGKATPVIDAAIDAGAQGATVHFARGVGVRQKLKLLGLAINPEKEIILVVTKADKTANVYEAMIKAGRLREPGMGFAYITRATNPVGFLDNSK
jgi:nitrogen regulatory protein P-II 1